MEGVIDEEIISIDNNAVVDDTLIGFHDIDSR
jgi:hypothetical protein